MTEIVGHADIESAGGAARAVRHQDLARIVDSLPALVSCWEIGDEWVLTYANEAYCRFWSKRPGEALVGKSGREITGDSLNPYIDLLEQRAMEGALQQYESVVRDGRGRTRSLLVAQIPGGPAAPRTVFTVAIDVTAQREAEREAAKGASELQLALAMAAHGYATLDGEGRIRLVNAALSEFLDEAAADIIGREVSDLIIEGERTSLARSIAKLAASGGRLEPGEYTLVRGNGEEVSVILEVAFDTEGGTHFGIATFRIPLSANATGAVMLEGRLSRRKPASLGLPGVPGGRRGAAQSDWESDIASLKDDGLGLTPRQVEVVRLIALGHSNREIAEALSISVETAKWHVKQILAKTNASTRAEAVAKFLGASSL